MKIIATVGKHMYQLMTRDHLPKRAVVFGWLVNFIIFALAVFLLCKSVSLFLKSLTLCSGEKNKFFGRVL